MRAYSLIILMLYETISVSDEMMDNSEMPPKMAAFFVAINTKNDIM